MGLLLCAAVSLGHIQESPSGVSLKCFQPNSVKVLVKFKEAAQVRFGDVVLYLEIKTAIINFLRLWF